MKNPTAPPAVGLLHAYTCLYYENATDKKSDFSVNHLKIYTIPKTLHTFS